MTATNTAGQGDVGAGQLGPQNFGSEFNKIAFLVRSMIVRLDTMKLVQVKAVHGGGGAVAAAGTVDVLPLVMQIDGNANTTPHGTVYGIPWWRLGGGFGSIICDPKVDDIGMVFCADRDITNVVSTKAQAAPGSRRKYSISDGIYIGAVLGEAPEQYLAFTEDGIVIADSNGNVLRMTSTGFVLEGNTRVQGTLTVTGEVIAKSQGVNIHLSTHLHTSGGSGSPTSTPTAGT